MTLTKYYGAPGTGKALSLDTPLPTPTGWTTMEKVEVGDELFDDAGNPCVVTFISQVMYGHNLYRVVFDDESYIDADGDHLWQTLTRVERQQVLRRTDKFRAQRRRTRVHHNKGKRPDQAERMRNRIHPVKDPPIGKIRSTEEIKSTLIVNDGRRNHSIQVCEPLNAPTLDLPIPPYTLGAWLGDGTSSTGDITCYEPEILERIKQDGFEISDRKDEHSHGILGLRTLLREQGILNNKHIPSIYLRASKKQRLDLLQGLMDTDGSSKDNDGESQTFCSTKKKLAEGFDELLHTFGIKHRMRPRPAKLYGKTCGTRYRFHFTTSTLCFNLSRKAESVKKDIRQTQSKRYIVGIQSLPSKPVKCVTVDSPSHLYLAGKAMIPTHNTYKLIENVQKELENGLNIDEIGYLGFTRAAAEEALSRATKKFFGITLSKKLWFRTIHSACLYLLRQRGISEKVADFRHRKDFCRKYDLQYTWEGEEGKLGDQTPQGNLFFNIHGYIENAMLNPDEWKETDFSVDFERDFPFLYDKWVDFKDQLRLIDFSDMIYYALDNAAHIPTRVLFVDEFQDLSPLQYRVVQQFMIGKERVYGAGDDDQALYRFQAAVPEIFLNLKADENHILPKSYRLPSEIWEKSKGLISRNTNRQEKNIEPREEGGIVKMLSRSPPWTVMNEIEGPTYILFRTNYLMNKFGWEMAKEGILYRFIDSKKEKALGWTSKKKREIYHRLYRRPDYTRQLNNLMLMGEIKKGYGNFIEYYIKNYGKYIEPRNITTSIGTIHSAKGREADTVILFDDITGRVANGMRTLQGLEDERRVFYVGMTRTREKLVIVHKGFGSKTLSFDLPMRLREFF